MHYNCNNMSLCNVKILGIISWTIEYAVVSVLKVLGPLIHCHPTEMFNYGLFYRFHSEMGYHCYNMSALKVRIFLIISRTSIYELLIVPKVLGPQLA
jgi:hypothetical protein